MRQLQSSQDRERSLNDLLEWLEDVNKKISMLSVLREELNQQIITHFNHSHVGQKTYEFDRWRVEIKTPNIYSFDKKRYESGEVSLPCEFNPIKESISYTLDKRLCDEYLSCAPPEVIEQLSDLIEIRPGKASIVLKERI